jgi:hypothetical protein
MTPHKNLAACCVLAMVSFAGVAAFGQAPEVILHSSSQIPQSVLLSIRPHSTGWVLLEASSDLASWQPVVNLLTTNSSGPFVDYPPSNSLVRFYRARSPGVTATQALSSWQAVRPAHFQYVLQNTKLDAGGIVWSGTVTISNGVKTVTNVTANGIPTTSFDPADFLAPEEVFALITTVESQGVKLAHVTYDEQWSFPASVVVVFSTPTPITDYRMSEFVDLSVAHGQANKVTGANSRPASPLDAGRQFGRAACAPPFLSTAVAQFCR